MDRKNDRFQKKAKKDSMIASKKAGNVADLKKNLNNYEIKVVVKEDSSHGWCCCCCWLLWRQAGYALRT